MMTVFQRKTGKSVKRAAALALALTLAACQGSEFGSEKHQQPVSRSLSKKMNSKDMGLKSPIMVRLFKQESELEVWKQTKSGQYALLETFEICKWSGKLGPKIKEGDRQAPEGFYNISPGRMNPFSSYYLSFNLGFPNKFDRAHNRTGSNLMVHGACSSAGCYAMTDEQIADIYAMGRDSFLGGQRKFQVQAFPFRMTAVNMAKNAGSEHYEFWKMLKRGSDHFSITKRPPAIEVCNKQYVFDAKADRRGDKFDATGACPAYTVPENIAVAVAEKQNKDARETAATLIAMETTKRRKQKIATFFGGASTTDAAAQQEPNATPVNVEAAKVLALTPEQSPPAAKKASENERAFSYFTSLFSTSRVSEEKKVVAEVDALLPGAPAPRIKPQ
ncbi:murein L,D-transpeptidase family protein [Pseudovibrio sp. Tun.PSC04-5.I4]|uniref:L,D-transpeptidase family protein n=1 Tax=Pseudovibrio sp. Tun.PSC04-5.I4 TaxID=1798213 RepID=UPI0008808C55|nr:murein L,D-transpeptidase family protein [Pseudovibrio sp. Tun.PSC04-5.I4]SDR28749.1 Murein L,D-transpeptidase YafK [Pseudovibrio sp. Tun.PSC04-5.I4]